MSASVRRIEEWSACRDGFARGVERDPVPGPLRWWLAYAVTGFSAMASHLLVVPLHHLAFHVPDDPRCGVDAGWRHDTKVVNLSDF